MYLHQTFPVFKRVSPKVLTQLLCESRLREREYEYGHILHVPGHQSPDAPVYILLNGKVVLRSFSFDEAYNFTPLQVATCGHILGAQKMDDGQSCKANVFPVVQSKIVNLIEMTLETFEFLWRQGQTRESEIFLNSIGLCKVFANLSEQTRTRIGCEDGQVRTL